MNMKKYIFNNFLKKSLTTAKSKSKVPQLHKFASLKNFSSAVELDDIKDSISRDEKLFMSNKIIKDRVASIYNTHKESKKRENEEVSEIQQEENLPESESESIKSDIEEKMTVLSEFLKSLEFSRTFNIKHSKYIEVRRSIPILNKDDIKKGLFEILADQSINVRKEDELAAEVVEMNKISSSYSTVFDEDYYNRLVTFFQEVGKFFLKSDIYSVDHTVNLSIGHAKETMLKLAEMKSILEFINFSDLKDEQLVKIFPVLVMLSNIYNISDIVMEKLSNEIVSRLFNPTKGEVSQELTQSKYEELFRSYLVFILINNFISANSKMNLKYLIIYKDFLLRNNDFHDLLYLITDNIFKFINSNRIIEDIDGIDTIDPSLLAIFEEFLFSYFMFGNGIAEENQSKVLNEELVENFFNSLFVLHNYNSNIPAENKILSSSLLSQIEHFILKVLNNSNVASVFQRDNGIQTFLDIENLFVDQDSCNYPLINKLGEINELLPLHNNLEIDRLKFLYLTAGQNYKDTSSAKKIIKHTAIKIYPEVIKGSLSRNEFIQIIKCFSKYNVIEAKKLFERGYSHLIVKNIKLLKVEELADLLIAVTRGNFLNTYEVNNGSATFLPLFQFVYKVNSMDDFSESLQDKAVDLAWALSFFSLKSREFTPIFEMSLINLKNYIAKKHAITRNEAKNILQVLSVLELMMKFQLTEKDYTTEFNAEFISTLLSICSIQAEMDVKYKYISNILFEKLKHFDHLTLTHTNLEFCPVLSHKEDTLPLLLVDKEDFNIDNKLTGEYFIKYEHLKSFFQIPPVVLNVDTVKSFEDLDKEYMAYKKAPKNAYRKLLE